MARCEGYHAAAALLEHSERARGSDDFPSLLALASTCRALFATLQKRRAHLAHTCWLRAFGSDTLGACAAWQRIEQLGGSAYEARWRWMHALRTGKPLQESMVELAQPTKAQMQPVEFNYGGELFADLFSGNAETLSRSWSLDDAAFVAVGGHNGAPLLELLVCTANDAPCRGSIAFRTGEILHLDLNPSHNYSYHQAEPVVAFGGVAVELVLWHHHGDPQDVALLDFTSGSTLHQLCRVFAPPPPSAPAGALRPKTRPWVTDGLWSADGARLVLWGKHSNTDTVQPNAPADRTTMAVYVYDINPANAPPAGPLPAAHTLVVPNFHSLAFRSDGGLYTIATDGLRGSTAGTLYAWDIASGEQIAAAPVAYEVPSTTHAESNAGMLAPFQSEVCISLRGSVIGVRCARTLEHAGRLAVPPLRGGHGQKVCAMRAVGDVLLSLDQGGILLAWHVPTRQLLRRLGRNVFTAPPASSTVRSSTALALTSRGVAVLEDDFCAPSQARLYDWLP